jgi:hypothetical protein
MCRILLSKQLLRTDGIIGLCEAVFGARVDDHVDAPLQKLEHFARVLCAVPSGMKMLVSPVMRRDTNWHLI